MGFTEDLQQLSNRILALKPNIQTEEATKMSMIIPFFQLLGYDVFNPTEFCPEYTADVGIKKGEKVDYAILIEGKPAILIECKSCNDVLTKHASQLFRYFGTTSAKFAILTNGIVYRFFTDLDESNKMDLTPFLEIDLSNLKETLITPLKKFCKQEFAPENIFSTASDLKYTSAIKTLLLKEMDEPTDDFVRFILANTYDGLKTQKVIDSFKPIVKKSFTTVVNDLINQKISTVLQEQQPDEPAEETPIEPLNKIFTTADELQAFFIVRGILASVIPIEDIAYRDTESYFGILYKDNNRKPICRFNLDTKRLQLLLPDENKKFERIYIDSLNDIYKYSKRLTNIAVRYATK